MANRGSEYMAFEPNYEKVISSYRKRLGTTQAQIECKLPVNEDTEISKILCADAKAYIGSAEAMSGEVTFNGFVNFQVIYDGAEPQGMDYTAEFKEKYQNTVITPNSVPVISSSIVNVDTGIVGSEVKVTAIVEFVIDVIETVEYNVLSEVDTKDVFSKTDTLTYSTYVGNAKNRFEQNFDIEINEKISKVLGVCSNAQLTSVTPRTEFAEIKGVLNVGVSYFTAGEEPVIKTLQKQVEFAQEVPLKEIGEDSYISGDIAVLSGDTKVTTNLDENLAVVNLDIPMMFNGYVFNPNSNTYVTDLFAINNYVNVDTESLALLTKVDSKAFEERFDANIVIDETMPLIDDIIGTCGKNVTIASQTISGNTLNIEGINTVTVLYLNRENNSTNSVLIESPFSLSFNIEGIDGLTPDVEIVMGEVFAKGKRGNEIEANGDLYIYANFFGETTEAVITSVKLGEERNQYMAPLMLYIVKPGETLWDVAKNLSVSPDLIIEQNPNLEFPLKGGERIRVYRQRMVNF